MILKQKYIKTKENRIIVFSELLQHSEFKSFNPVSAGFISIGVDEQRVLTCSCYGESVSLRLKSDEEQDSELSRRQILGQL